MIDPDALSAQLSAAGVGDWADALLPLVAERLSPAAHGDFNRWQDALAAIGASRDDPPRLRDALLELRPWRKGPFEFGGVMIDAEWQSDLKWSRVAKAIEPLAGRSVLDVGCGNGYYACRMRDAGAANVIGIDPTLLYVMQFLAVNLFRRDDGIAVLPLRLEELPAASRRFDTTFSMGVLYHQRAPIDHLRQLRGTLRPGGQLVLETIVLPDDVPYAATPPDRYARMKNVWLLPGIPELLTWLGRTGFTDVQVADLARTTPDEQRSTEWMPFESLAEALDPEDRSLTVEGWPAPHRAVLTASG